MSFTYTPEELSNFLRGLAYCASGEDLSLEAEKAEDDFTKVTFFGDDGEGHLETKVIRFRPAEVFRGSYLLEVERANRDGSITTFYLSAVPYLLFGAVYCEV